MLMFRFFMKQSRFKKDFKLRVEIMYRPPPHRQPIDRVVASRAGGPGSIPGQGPRHTKGVIKMVPVVPLFGTQR